MGRSCLENAGRSNCKCFVALFISRLERPADDGAKQHRIDYRPAAGCEPARDFRGQKTLPEAGGDCFVDGGVKARSVAQDCATDGGRWCGRVGIELWMSARNE